MTYKYIIIGSSFFVFGMFGFLSPLSTGNGVWHALSFSAVALADDEDDEGEEGGDEEGDVRSNTSPSSTRKSSSTKTIMQTVTRQVTTYETRLMNDPEFLTDTDGDLLVDAIDPEPNRDQREYFTDTDGDGVPNAFDKHHDDDDFAYYDDDDTNKNGILDSYE
jgi:hypothetical protein